MDQDVIVTAKFVDNKSGQPLNGEKYWIMVLDKGFIKDRYMDQQELDTDGRIKGLTNLEFAKDIRPDIYFKLYRDTKVIYKSPIFKRTDFLQGRSVAPHPYAKDFGTFRV